MKKGSYWFSFLSEKEQKEFRENCEIQDFDFIEIINDIYESFEVFILSCFHCMSSEQGGGYWFEISNRNVQ
jgi:hypothetical protein